MLISDISANMPGYGQDLKQWSEKYTSRDLKQWGERVANYNYAKKRSF